MDEQSNARARALWSERPVGSQRSEAPQGSLQYFDDLRAYRYGYETPFIPEVFRFAELRGKRVLEIGVGNGIDAVEMASHGAHYSGIDITDRHLTLTRQNFELRGLRFERLVCGDLLETDPGGPFDVIYSFGVLHHIAHEADYLRRIHQLLHPDGRLRIAVYASTSFFNAYLLATWLARNKMRAPLDAWRSHLAELSPLESPVTIKIRSRRAVERELVAADLRPIAYWKRGFVQRYLPLVGGHLSPNGPVLRACGSMLGWYHIFECMP